MAVTSFRSLDGVGSSRHVAGLHDLTSLYYSSFSLIVLKRKGATLSKVLEKSTFLLHHQVVLNYWIC